MEPGRSGVRMSMTEQQRLGMLEQLLGRAAVYSEFMREELEASLQEDAAHAEDSVEQDVSPRPGQGRKRLATGPQDSGSAPPSKNKRASPSLERAVQSVENSWIQLVPKLREYQMDGIKWLSSLYDNGMNGILADEMGLGKTVQSIGLLCNLMSKNIRGPFLVVAPLSTIHNWKLECARFAPAASVLVYHGSKDDRARMFDHSLSEKARLNDMLPHVVITTYEMIIQDQKRMALILWKYLIIDEAHRLKNFNCKLFRTMKTLQSENRLLLTGTPLQNNLSELWSLLNFVLPDVFPDCASFEELFDFSEDSKIVESEAKSQVVTKLHRILGPFVLRRLKSDVLESLPPKREVLLFCDLTTLQVEMSQAILEGRIHQWLERKRSVESAARRGVSRASAGGLQMKLVQLQKCHNHPCLFGSCVLTSDDKVIAQESAETNRLQETLEERQRARNSERVSARLARSASQSTLVDPLSDEFDEDFFSGAFEEAQEETAPSPSDPPLDEFEEVSADALLASSHKLQLLDRILQQCQRLDKKVLLFSRMTRMLDLLEVYLESRRFQYCRIDGSVGLEDRQAAIDAFNGDPELRVFLLSTRAGGLGINLASADTVIFYDNDWNPHADLQAQDRCHRIGQEKEVLVIRLVPRHSVDEYVLDRASKKLTLDRLVMHRRKFKGTDPFQEASGDKGFDPEELMSLLQCSFKPDEEGEGASSSSSGTVSDQVLEAILSGGLSDMAPRGPGYLQLLQDLPGGTSPSSPANQPSREIPLSRL